MKTQTQTRPSKAPFKEFGLRLSKLRQAAGINRQADFARLVKSTQQTVSRWEAGLSRPRDRQMPLVASVLGSPVDELRLAAGYAVKTVVATFDQPFPIEALSPESFERFCVYLLQRLYPAAKVHQMGNRGHTQDGTDIIVTLPDGVTHSYQCKRAEEFGPQKIHAAVAKHRVKAAKKFLVLSRVASPQAREAVAPHKDWDLWDKDDISTKIRGLPKVDQISLVDIFFSGRRFELLGVTEEGVWETTQDFFAPFENARGLFNHTWKLVGREKAIDELSQSLKDNAVRVVFLVGSGGSGKSRVLKQAIESYEASHKGYTVRFLNRTAETTKKSLEELGDKPALLIVDDAHDRTDLLLLLQFVATSQNVRLVLALRPYGLEHLKAQASNFSLIDAIRDVKLEPLTKEEAERLATQVLKRENGPLEVAKDIARLTYDCPLATVVGAQIVAREKKHFDLAKNEDAFRSTLFGRFESVIAGEIGQKADAELIKKLLRVLALFQPFYLDDKALLVLILKLESIQPHDTNRLLKLLVESGVLFKRGARYRLSPDVLADYIIEANCVGAQGKSTGYAEAAFDAADERLIETLLLNLGKLDWRLSDGDASNSHLLDGVWAKLEPHSEYADPYIRSVQSVAFYQPLRAITFGEDLIRKGKFTNQLSETFKYAAYNLAFLPRACEALWQLGKEDKRQLHQHPNHPIRVLAELCEVQPNKPLSYNEAVVEFGLRLAADPAAWSHNYTPLDILAAIFKTEGHTTTSKNHAIAFNPFTVNPKAVVKLRKRVLDLVIELLGNANTRVATRAAAAIGEALRYPTGLLNLKVEEATRNAWTKLFCETLENIELAVKQNQYDPLVRVGIANAVSWHAHYSKSATSAAAKRVRSALTSSLDYRVQSTLVDGYGMDLRRIDAKNFESVWDKHLKSIAAAVVAAYPKGEDLRRYIAAQLDHIQKGSAAGSSAPYVLYGTLLRSSAALARATIEDALRDAQSVTKLFAGDALLALWKQDIGEARKVIAAFLASGRDDLSSMAGRAIAAVDFTSTPCGKDEVDALKTLVTSSHTNVVASGIAGLRAVSRFDVDQALALARQVNVGTSSRLADDLLCLFTFRAELPFARLTEVDVAHFLEKLMGVSQLDGHWTETFLANASKNFPERTLDFFVKRVEHAVAEKSWEYRPINHGPYVHVPLKFSENPVYASLLTKVVGWMAGSSYEEEQKVIFNHRARELFEAIFGTFDDEVVRFIERWSETADEAAFELIGSLLAEAPHTFVFTRTPFVFALLTRAHSIGAETHKEIVSAFFRSAFGGMRQGVAGQPFPRDVEMKANCQKILETLSTFSPAYELFDELLKYAEGEIKRSLRDRDDFED